MLNVRKPLSAAVRIVVLAAVFLAVFGSVAGCLALALGYLRGTPFASPPNLYGGMVCGLIAWLFVTAFHVKREQVSWSVNDRATFLAGVKAYLEEMGYQRERAGPGHAVYRPGFHAFLFGGRIQVTLEGSSARVAGPKFWVEALRKRLRFQSHVSKARPPLEAGTGRPERFLKRLQLSARVPPEQWDAFGAHVLAPLVREGEVFCDLNLLVQGEAGVRESLLEGPVRAWLERAGLEAEVRKDYVQMDVVTNPGAWQPTPQNAV